MFVTHPGGFFRSTRVMILVAALACMAGCGGNAGFPAAGPIAPTPVAPGPTGGTGSTTSGATIQHVVVVVLENHSYSSVIGSSDMPYLNGLATKYALATNYYGDVHPSLPNYFMLTTGNTIALDDSYAGPTDAANIAQVLTAAGKTWKAYAESLPSPGYTGATQYPYDKEHNPFAYFSGVLNDPAQVQNIVPFRQFASDLSSGALPNFAFVVPNLQNDAHDGTLAQADAWLSSNINPLVQNPAFAQTLLIITFDEGDLVDFTNGGGHVATVIAGGPVKQGFQSSTQYQHQSLLRFVLESLGVSDLPGAAAGAPDMREFLQ